MKTSVWDLKSKDVYVINSHPCGLCLIIENIDFDSLPRRDGSERDSRLCKELFSSLGFLVNQHTNLTTQNQNGCEGRHVYSHCVHSWSITVNTNIGYVSVRDVERGSWFVNGIVYVLMKYSWRDDLLTLFTRVNHLIGDQVTTDGVSQTPTFMTTMKKRFYFNSPG
ncbi:uncharacterized protein LOC118761171 [Octopus sinensis]|uniref:Uncharacterized protein LOC118761171 n=1 Tax=Octopus sinensis TaxID=2607531 RepID=A0A7E6EIT0_9MOLL|nr:uncharacterized protein LOC118761171 [Octopus sinensis]